MEKRFLNVEELAVYLGMSKDAIRNWKKRGEIPFSKFGRSVRFDLRRIEPWLKNKECVYVKRNFLDESRQPYLTA
jgi:excisionase family DNA binding protein